MLVRALLTPWFHLMVAWLGVISLTWNLIAFALYPLLPARAGQAIGRAGIAWGYRFYWMCARASGLMRIDTLELDALGREPGGLIIAANHPSMADAMLIVASLPRAVCIMKASLLHNVFLGAGARLARYIANDSPFQMVRSAVHSVKQGGHLVLFPEGTRTVGGKLNRFRPGVAVIADKAATPIQTVFIETDSPFLSKGWPIWQLPPVPMVFRLRLGRRFEPSSDHKALLAELENYFKQELAR